MSAPAAIALTMSPRVGDAAVGDDRDAELRAGGAANQIADSCGMPAPVTTRVVQIEPAPTPTLTASAPASASASTPSSVTTLPATTGRFGHDALIRSIALITPAEWPWAVSIATASTPARDERLDALLEVGADADRRGAAQAAAACRAVAFGNSWRLWMSFTVISPARRPSASTSGSFSMRCFCRIALASSSVVPTRGGDQPLAGHEVGDRSVEVGAASRSGCRGW